jgi:hypothetical protein
MPAMLKPTFVTITHYIHDEMNVYNMTHMLASEAMLLPCQLCCNLCLDPLLQHTCVLVNFLTIHYNIATQP